MCCFHKRETHKHTHINRTVRHSLSFAKYSCGWIEITLANVMCIWKQFLGNGPKFIFHIISLYLVKRVFWLTFDLMLFIINDERLSNTYFRIISLHSEHFEKRYTPKQLYISTYFNPKVAHHFANKLWNYAYRVLKIGLHLYAGLEGTRNIKNHQQHQTEITATHTRTHLNHFWWNVVDKGILYITVHWCIRGEVERTGLLHQPLNLCAGIYLNEVPIQRIRSSLVIFFQF